MTSGAKFFIIVAAIGVVAATAAVLILKNPASPAPGNGPPPGVVVEQPRSSDDPTMPDNFVSELVIPSFKLVDQDGKPVSNEIFSGCVTVIDFVFTHCPFICPTLTGTMSSMADKLAGTPVRFASFSVDPERDTPERLREYARLNGIDLARWAFITGDKAVIWGILNDGIKWAIEERPEQVIDLPDGTKMSNIRHPAWLALVGPDGRLLSMCTDIQDQAQLEKFTARARAAAERLAPRK
jgi:cytochrome oxidase Cu insertion factor (SCO1/SenC/PrrC family)